MLTCPKDVQSDEVRVNLKDLEGSFPELPMPVESTVIECN